MTDTYPAPLSPPTAHVTAPARPRLIATDLDGTLLRDDKTISARTLDALEAASRAGIEVVFATGRAVRWMTVVAPVAGRSPTICSHAICSNGALVVDLRAPQRPLRVRPLRTLDALEVARAVRAVAPEVSFAVERLGGIHHEAGYLVRPPDPTAVVAAVDRLLDDGPPFAGEPVLKLLARHPEYEPDAFLRLVAEAAGPLASVTRSGPLPLVEISARRVSKASTLAAFCASRGVRPEEVMAFGDMPNDLEMLAWSGHSYAMANAHPAVLAASTRRAATNEDDGVARAIEELLGGA